MSRRVRFGDNIKILRSRNKMTQQDLADKLHVARQVYRKCINHMV